MIGVCFVLLALVAAGTALEYVREGGRGGRREVREGGREHAAVDGRTKTPETACVLMYNAPTQ